MKKEVLFVFLMFFLIMNFSLIFAQNNNTIDDSAYDCLKDNVEDNCDELTFEQQIFSLLAIGECRDEVEDNDNFMEDTKLTAQAILGLARSNVDTEDAEEWLLEPPQTTETGEDLVWLLQIESNDATTCTISYEDESPLVTVNADKTVGVGTSSCFNLFEEGYWLRVSSDCYGQEFTISCSAAFSTNLIYKRIDDLTLHVLGDTSSASAGGKTTEQVDSYCFTDGTSCDYETSLWVALALNLQGNDVSSYLPYLITFKDDTENEPFLPDSFLYSLTNDYKGELLATPLPVSDNRYYDTALAFLPFQKETLDEKTIAINWLAEVQGSDGCWNGGNIRDTAFILYSLWPRAIIGIDDGDDCENSNYYCLSPISCSEAGGDELEDYSGCFGTSVCCSSPPLLESCDDQGGYICGSGEECTVSTSEASDTTECCLGSCITPTEETECELYVDGNCRSSCYSDEEEANYECDSGDVCCIEQVAEEGGNYWWIWILIVLIILVIVGIIFKDKLRQVWFKFKSKVLKDKKKPSGPFKGPPRPPAAPPLRPMPPRGPPRKVFPLPKKQPASKPGPKPKGDIDDVLKKLKEMGK